MGRSALILGLPHEPHVAKRGLPDLPQVPYNASSADLRALPYWAGRHVENLAVVNSLFNLNS